MLNIELRFPAGRFHATPWGRHVNEGAVEWPPSPWRFLRALIATWHLKDRAGSIDEPMLRALIAKLASVLPVYQLPRATPGHTRHYMPINEGKNEKRTKVFDTFLHPAGALKIRWPVQLDGTERAALDTLLKSLGYFGRAESLVEASLLPDNETIKTNAQPFDEKESLPKGWEIVRLLASITPDDYANWRAERLSTSQNASGKSAARTSKKRAAKESESDALPADVFEALHADTGDLQAAGWNLPPGSQLSSYTRPQHIFEVEPVRHAVLTRKALPTVARYAVASAVLPRITQAISVAERVHQSLVKFSNSTPVFTGCDAAGRPMVGHRHAHIFCESSDEHRDAITHVTVYAPMGFDAAARTALKLLRKVWGHGGHDLQLVLLGIGDRKDFSEAEDGCPLMATSAAWKSLTPFVPTRHPKNHRDGRPKLDAEGWHIGSPEHDLRRLILERGDLPAPTKIERRRAIDFSGHGLRCLQFQRERKHGDGLRGDGLGYSFRLMFSKPVAGPLAFGYGAHFGLGLFVPEAKVSLTE
jgi:CRISPR-associated protein Csb2